MEKRHIILLIVATINKEKADYSNFHFFIKIFENIKEDFSSNYYNVDKEQSKFDLTDGVEPIELLEIWWLMFGFKLSLLSLVLSWLGLKGTIGLLMEKITFGKLCLMLTALGIIVLSSVALAISAITIFLSSNMLHNLNENNDEWVSAAAFWLQVIATLVGCISFGAAILSYGLGAKPDGLFIVATAVSIATLIIVIPTMWIVYRNQVNNQG